MNKKTLVIILCIILIIILLKAFVFYDKYKLPKGAEINVLDKTFEVYDEDITYKDLIDNTNVNILTDEGETIDTYTVGDKVFTIEYKYKGIRKYKYDLKYKVSDTTKPVFIKEPPATISYYINEVTNEDMEKLKAKAVYADNYDPEPTYSMTGTVDSSVVGEYTLVSLVEDSSGNQLTKNTIVTIKERPVVVETEEKKPEEQEPKEEEEEKDDSVYFAQQVETYKKGNAKVGIDVSKWQGEVDFEKVRAEGVEFVILRLGVMKDKDTPLAKDVTFDTNFKNAKAAGLKVGVYVYSEADTVEKALENAKFVEENVKAEDLDFPVAFDWEYWAKFHEMKINLHRLQEMYTAFNEELESKGYETMLYSSQNYVKYNLWGDVSDYNLWIARYSDNAPDLPDLQFMLWQNTDKGKVDGIDGSVDLDIYYESARKSK